MLITDLSKDIALILPALILVEGVIGLVAWFALGSRGGRAARIAAWMGLVTLTLWCGSAAAFVLLNVIYFAFGSSAAIAAAAVITLAMVAMPFGWALAIRHHAASNPTEAASQPL
jgi:hypothetical protein